MAGFDCSGLVIELLKSVQVLPRTYDNTAQGLLEDLEPRSISHHSPSFGALCFFGRSLKRIPHVGFAVDDYRMIEAGGGSSSTKTLDVAIRQNAFVRIRPIGHRKDFQKILIPDYDRCRNLPRLVPRDR